MEMTELVPWRGSHLPAARRDSPVRRGEEFDPFWMLSRQVDRLFDTAFRGFFWGFGFGLFGSDRGMAWPNIDIAETDNEVRITAELPEFDEDDLNVEVTNNVPTIQGEKKSVSEDRNPLFSGHSYRRFERQIPLDCDVTEEKVAASFHNGVLAVTLPKSARAPERTKRIPINGG
jgi:HSP20 family protein